MICVYFLLDAPAKRCRCSYVGFTTNLCRRTRQHKGIISGGARRTRQFREVHTAMFIGGFPTKRKALSYEWFAKRNGKLHCHKTMLRFKAPHRRVCRFFAPLRDHRFSSLVPQLTVHLNPDFFTAKDADRIRSFYKVDCVLSLGGVQG